MREQDDRGRIVAAEKKSLQKGKEEGEENKEIEMVLKLHKKGFTSQEISDLLEIPLERVEQIIKKSLKY